MHVGFLRSQFRACLLRLSGVHTQRLLKLRENIAQHAPTIPAGDVMPSVVNAERLLDLLQSTQNG
jgi:hypothetical protein